MARTTNARSEAARQRRIAKLEAAVNAARVDPAAIPALQEIVEQQVERIVELDTEDTALAEPDLAPNRSSVVPLRWQRVYAANPLKGTCGDSIAQRLHDAIRASGPLAAQRLQEIGAANGIDVNARWGSRNPGMQRMNLGNVLRGRVKHGIEIVITCDSAPHRHVARVVLSSVSTGDQ